MIALRAAARTHTGYVRTNNEDLAVLSGDLVAIADGMGGHLGGEVAARTAIEALIASFRRDRTPSGLVAAVRRANAEVWRRSRAEQHLHGMGTTLTAFALVPVDGTNEPHVVLVNVGDSRAYRLERDGDEPRLVRLTEDHSVVEEMVRQGELTPTEAAAHPHRHVLTRALGIDSDVDVDVWDLEPEPGTRLLLCSDGLSDDVPEEEIARVLDAHGDPDEAASELVDTALAHGGIDNVTVAVIDVTDGREHVGDEQVRLVPARTPGPDKGDADRPDVTQALPIATPSEPPPPEGSGGPETVPYVPEVVPGPHTDPAGVETVAAPLPLADPGPGAASEEPGRGAAHRRGRTMTVRGAAPPGSSLQEASLGRAPGVVLVPTKKLAKQYRDRVFTLRVFVFLVLMTALLGGVVAVVIWFERSSYFVGLDGNRVSIYQGRPGGILWFKPQLLETSSLTTKELLPNSVAEVRGGIEESSYKAARQELTDLVRLSREVGLSATRSGPPGPLLLAWRTGGAAARGGEVATMWASPPPVRSKESAV